MLIDDSHGLIESCEVTVPCPVLRAWLRVVCVGEMVGETCELFARQLGYTLRITAICFLQRFL